MGAAMRTILTAMLVVVFASYALADGLIRDGLGARSAGRGGTNIAWSDTGTVLHDNPAGVINMRGCSLLECDLEALIADCDYADPDGIASFDGDPVPLGNLSILKKVSPDVAYGLGVYSTGGFASDWQMQGPAPFSGDRTYKSFGALGRILPGISVRLTDSLSMGGTLGVAVSHIEVEGPYTLQSLPLQGTPTLLDLQGTGAALTWSLGFQYKLSCRTTLGATYQSESRFHLDGSTTAEVPVLGQSAFDLDLDIVWPRSVGLGIRHEFCAHRIGAIDLIYYNWSKAFDEAGMFLRNATNPAFVPFGTIEEQFPLQWRDTLSVRVGSEHVLRNSNRVRFGYAYHRNAIPNSTLTPYISPIMEHTLSVGYGTRISGWEVDYGYQFMTGGSQSIGASGLVGGDFDNSTTRAHAHFLFISFLRR